MTEIPNVNRCEATDCVYNQDRMCHTFAISVTHGSARCQTYATGKFKGGDRGAIAKVGSCLVDNCEYNRNLECQARGITVGHQNGDPADCLTYEARQPAEVK